MVKNDKVKLLREESEELERLYFQNYQYKNICLFLTYRNYDKKYLEKYFLLYKENNEKYVQYRDYLLDKYLKDKKIVHYNFSFFENILKYMEMEI